MPPADVCSALCTAAIPGSGIFTGEILGGRFQVVPNLSYRNSFRPVITGSIRAEGAGSRVSIHMELAAPVRVFLSIWFGGVTFFSLAGMLCVLAEGFTSAWPALCVPAVMLVFGQILVRLGFSIPARNALQKLYALIGGLSYTT